MDFWRSSATPSGVGSTSRDGNHGSSAGDQPVLMLEVHYEDLVMYPEREARRMLDYLNLPWDDGVLVPNNSSRRIETASILQVQRPIYSSSIGRWRAYEQWLRPLFDILSPAQ